MIRFFRTTAGVKLLLCLLLVAATLLPYVQVKDHGFITFDDDWYVTGNPMVRAGLTWEGVKWAFTAEYACHRHPLTWLSHMADCWLFGLWPGGHHLTNVAFHLANTLLLFLFWVRVTGALWPSALVAALFALHPLHVESVAWVSERKDVLSACCWLAAMWAYAGYASAPSIRRYLLVLLWFTLGLMAKPMLVTLPLVLLLLDYWPLGRAAGRAPWSAGMGAATSGSAPKPYWPLIRDKIPLLALSACFCLVTLAAQSACGAVASLAVRPLGPRLANALVAYVMYGVKMFWPYPMAFFYPLAPVPWWQAAGAAIVLLVLSVVLLSGGRRHPYLAVGWLWYLGTLVPVIGLVQVGRQALADRFTYVPSIGLFVILAWGASEITAGWRYRKIVLSMGGVALLAACLISSWVQVGYWRNSESLFNHAIRVTRDNYIAYHHLGMDLTNQGRYDEAIDMYEKTIELAPSYAHAYHNLGTIYARQRWYHEAVALYQSAIRLNPANANFYRNLAHAYTQLGKKAEADAALEQVKRLSNKQ